MRTCPWCGHENLNVYAYCQSCGRGWAGPDDQPGKPSGLRKWADGFRAFWPFGRKAPAA